MSSDSPFRVVDGMTENAKLIAATSEAPTSIVDRKSLNGKFGAGNKFEILDARSDLPLSEGRPKDDEKYEIPIDAEHIKRLEEGQKSAEATPAAQAAQAAQAAPAAPAAVSPATKKITFAVGGMEFNADAFDVTESGNILSVSIPMESKLRFDMGVSLSIEDSGAKYGAVSLGMRGECPSAGMSVLLFAVSQEGDSVQG